jgi:hypothetical protein
VVFAAEPLDPVIPLLGGGETTQRTLFVRLLSYIVVNTVAALPKLNVWN